MNTFIGETSKFVFSKTKDIGDGGQGYVIRAACQENGAAEVAIKWFKKAWATPEHCTQILSLINGQPPPKSNSQHIHFIWPIELVTSPDSDSFGYVMPLIDTSRFRGYYSMIEGDFTVPLRTLCRICYNLASAMRYVHRSGRCYGDLNFGNVMFDPTTGEICVLDNDNVVVNNTASGIRGIFEFMAPEVALGVKHPNRDSDIFSLAVTFYHLFTWHHPLDGRKTQALHCWDNIAKRQYFAENPLFVFDPGDKSNSTEGVPELRFHEERWRKLCPPSVKSQFLRLFTDGLKAQGKRPQIPDWQRVFLECEANAIVCDCGAKTIWSPDSWLCFKCGKNISAPIRLQFKHSHTGVVHLAGSVGGQIRKHHLEPDALDPEKHPSSVVGTLEAHPKVAGHLILRNGTTQTWHMTTAKGEQLPIEPGLARPLVPGAKIQIEKVLCEVH